MPLTVKQKLFVEHYLAERNGTQAARRAGYAGDDVTLAAVAYENLRKPQIRAEIDKRLEPFILSANEVLSGLSNIADIDIAQVFEPDGSFDLVEAKKRGVSKYIKSISFDKDTGRVTKVEVYSAHEGLRDMGKHRGLFPTRIELSRAEADDAINKSGAPLPETFHGEPVVESEM